MSAADLTGDQARVTALIEVPPEIAFRAFTEEIDQWWRRGVRYRVSRKGRGILHLESGVGGRLFEVIELKSGASKVIESGRVTAWEPPHRLVFDWRNVNFAPSEKTEVEVLFAASPSGTRITVTHRGWSGVRADHPARHGLEVGAFLRMMGLWWGDLMSALRMHVKGTSTDA